VPPVERRRLLDGGRTRRGLPASQASFHERGGRRRQLRCPGQIKAQGMLCEPALCVIEGEDGALLLAPVRRPCCLELLCYQESLFSRVVMATGPHPRGGYLGQGVQGYRRMVLNPVECPLDVFPSIPQDDGAAVRAAGRMRSLRQFGEERMAPRIARAIVADRKLRPFERTTQLAQMIARVSRSRERHKHPATRVFQALRIYVNAELDQLQTALESALARLAPNGRLAVISFHSLEDRMVKQFMRRHASPDPVYAGLPDMPAHARPTLRLVGKSVEPTGEETERNPRARSARLRVAERLSQGIAA